MAGPEKQLEGRDTGVSAVMRSTAGSHSFLSARCSLWE